MNGTTSTQNDFWSKGRAKDAFTVIDRLLSILTDHGFSIGNQLQYSLDVLSIEALSRGKVRDPALTRILKAMKAAGENATFFEDRFHTHFKDSARRVVRPPQHEWTLYFPFNMTLDETKKPARVEVVGRRFLFSGWPSVFRRITKDTLLGSLKNGPAEKLSSHLTDTCVSVSFESTADTILAAWSEIESAFDALRGALELTLGLGSMRLMSSHEKARRHVPCPLWGVGHIEAMPPKSFAFYTHEEDKEASSVIVSKQAFAVFKNNAELLKPSAEGSLNSLLADGLRLYSQAMDARMDHECFLGLWQLAEALTLVGRYQGNRDKLCSRLSWFSCLWKETDMKCLKDCLEVLYEKRNLIVHRGIHRGISCDDVNILKANCEAALSWLHGQCRNLPSMDHLDHFFNYVKLSDHHRTTMEDTLRYVKKRLRQEL